MYKFSSRYCILFSSIALVAVFSGCFTSGRQISETVADPPDVPILEAEQVDDGESNPLLSDTSELASFELFTYEDIEKLPHSNAYHRLLKQAIEYSIDQGVLRKPAWAGRSIDAAIEARMAQNQVTDKTVGEELPTDAVAVSVPKPVKPILFEPDKPMTYGEFYKWHERFRVAIAEENKLPPDIKPDIKPETAEVPPETPPKKPQLPPGPLNAKLDTHGVALTERSEITREQLCLLLALVQQQAETLSELDAQSVEGMRPDDADVAQSLEHFKDYQSITPGLKRFVGYAYQNGMLRNLWGMTPVLLTEDRGFNPRQPITRGQALVLLYQALKKPEN